MQLTDETLARFASQHKTIKRYIDDLPPEAIYNRIQADKYSIHETIAYLTRYHHVFLERLHCIKEEINPFFELYKPDEDSVFRFTSAKTTGSLLHELYRLRCDVSYFLEQLQQNEWSRVGSHAVLGKMDIAQWVEFFMLHESNQLFRIFKMAAGFWQSELSNDTKIIYLPRLSHQVDEMAV